MEKCDVTLWLTLNPLLSPCFLTHIGLEYTLLFFMLFIFLFVGLLNAFLSLICSSYLFLFEQYLGCYTLCCLVTLSQPHPYLRMSRIIWMDPYYSYYLKHLSKFGLSIWQLCHFFPYFPALANEVFFNSSDNYFFWRIPLDRNWY